jgi:tetratricopeptide (TPR) repeat protein
LKANGGDALSYSAMGRLHELKNQLEQAAAAYKRALTLDPSQNRLHYLLSNVYRKMGNIALADQESALFQRTGMAEREDHINFVQRYYRGRSPSPAAGRGSPRP